MAHSAAVAQADGTFENPILRLTPPEERKRRIRALRELMEREGFDALVVCGRDDIRYRGRVTYVTDVWQLLSDAFVVIPRKGDTVFVGHPVLGLSQARLSDWVGDFRMSGYPGTEVANVLSDLGSGDGQIGIVGLSDALSARHLQEMQEALPGATLRDATQQFEELRQVKSEQEIDALRETSEVFRRIFAELEPLLKPGLREIDIAAEAHRIGRRHGCRSLMVLVDSTPFGEVSFGTTKEVRPEDILMVWIEGPGPSGYWLELRRLYSFGALPDDVRRFWELQTESVAAGVSALRAGAPAHEFVSTVGQGLAKGGWAVETDPNEQHHMYSLHGIGTDAIEGVWVPGKDRVVRENEVVNIHALVDFADDADAARFGGIGITDNILVTANGGTWMTYETPEIVAL